MIDISLKNANILIVDDQEANIDVLEGLLDMQGYPNIKTTTDSREVFNLFKSFKPDLILLDLQMPYLTGFEVMDQLKPLIPTNSILPILVLTADATIEAKQRALSGGATDFITKPFDLVEVGLRIKNLLFMSYLQQQLINQNEELEQKVKERTLELETKNIDLIAAKEKAEISDKLKSTFINNISHEVRTPLNGIIGFAQILGEPDITSDQRSEYLMLLNESSNRLIETVTNFMQISMLTSGTQEVYLVNLKPADILRETYKKFEKRCQVKNLNLSVAIPDGMEDVILNSDSDLLLRVMQHLMSNAIKFTNEGSIEIGYNRNKGDLCLYVKDDGIGMEQKTVDNLFDNFMQAGIGNTRAYDGSGLGLAITKGLAELLGGTIDVESAFGKGSMFSISFDIK